MPFLDPDRSPDEYYEISPYLFWSVIGVASRRYRDDPALVAALSKPVTELMWESIARAPLQLPQIQGLILACIWPFPTLRMLTDNTLLLCNLAFTAAMLLGLHRPNYVHEYRITKANAMLDTFDKDEGLKTWVACNIMGQMYVFNLR